jgi:hypothetical protein
MSMSRHQNAGEYHNNKIKSFENFYSSIPEIKNEMGRTSNTHGKEKFTTFVRKLKEIDYPEDQSLDWRVILK